MNSTGGTYTLSGTAGQPDAGVLSGGTCSERARPKRWVIRDRQVVLRLDRPGQPDTAAALANDAIA